MTDIKLGDRILGSITNTDATIADSTTSLGRKFFDEYYIKGVDSFRQLKISIGASYSKNSIQLVNSDTGAIIATADNTINQTTFPGVNYKIRVLNEVPEDYTLSLGDGGKATSIVSRADSSSYDNYSSSYNNSSSIVGTVGADGTYFRLANGFVNLTDVALSPNGQLYGIKSYGTGSFSSLIPIAPSLNQYGQSSVSDFKDAQGEIIYGDFNALEFGADNKLYALAGTNTGAKFYQIDVATSNLTVKGNLPQGLGGDGDLVYDAVNNRFLATSRVNSTTDALWQIPVGNPSGATKIGNINFTGVKGLSFENGQLTGFTDSDPGNNIINGQNSSIVGNRIKINASSGQGTLDRPISGIGNSLSSSSSNNNNIRISGASTILGSTTVTTSPTTPTLPNVITPTVVNTFPTSAANAIGSKSQTLAEGRTIDLTDYAGKILKVDTTTKGDAAYSNNIGFYAVQDSIGTIKLGNGTTLKPGDANYATEAVKSAVLRAAKIDSKSNQNITGGGIYAPVVVAQGTLDDFVSKNPTNGGEGKDIHAYFNYIGANPDKFDHFRLIGTNTFGVEDLYGGGDKDYNDLVVNMNVKTS
jgi:hypothetical protein